MSHYGKFDCLFKGINAISVIEEMLTEITPHKLSMWITETVDQKCKEIYSEFLFVNTKVRLQIVWLFGISMLVIWSNIDDAKYM